MPSDKVKAFLRFPKRVTQYQRVPVWFASVPRVGDWLEWSTAHMRVIGVEWCGNDGDPESVCEPVIYLEYAPFEEHPSEHPAWLESDEESRARKAPRQK